MAQSSVFSNQPQSLVHTWGMGPHPKGQPRWPRVAGLGHVALHIHTALCACDQWPFNSSKSLLLLLFKRMFCLVMKLLRQIYVLRDEVLECKKLVMVMSAHHVAAVRGPQPWDLSGSRAGSFLFIVRVVNTWDSSPQNGTPSSKTWLSQRVCHRRSPFSIKDILNNHYPNTFFPPSKGMQLHLKIWGHIHLETCFYSWWKEHSLIQEYPAVTSRNVDDKAGGVEKGGSETSSPLLPKVTVKNVYGSLELAFPRHFKSRSVRLTPKSWLKPWCLY